VKGIGFPGFLCEAAGSGSYQEGSEQDVLFHRMVFWCFLIGAVYLH
jgi:hypothetical protein